MKQQFTGSYTLDVASRTIVLSGIEIPQGRLAVVINSTVGFVYHNIEHEPTASVTVSGGDTTIVFPRYKDCETHRNTDALSIFYDDGIDFGQLLQNESDETQTLLTAFKDEAKAESDETQALLQSESDETQTLLSDFKTEVKAEADETQALLQSESDETQTILTAFQTEAKAESDETQALLQSESDEVQAAIPVFQAEVKAESDETQALLQSKSDEVQAAIPVFQAEVKAEADELQALLGGKLPDLAEGMVPAEALSLFEAPNDVDVDFAPGGYGPARIIYSRAGVTLRSVNLYYGDSGDALGKLIRVDSGWTPAEIIGLRVWLDASDPTSLVFNGASVSRLGDKSGNGNFADQPTAAFQPSYEVNGIGGRGVLLYNAAGQRLQFQSPLAIEENMVVASVWRRASPEINTIDLGRNAVNGQPLAFWWGSTNFINSALGTAFGLQIFSNSTATGDFISFARRDSATATISLNGAEVGIPKVAPPVASQLDFVGYRPGANQTHDGFWGETIVASDNSLATKQKIEGYLSHKWTIPLPASHPYFLSPP